jgi:hypothetical protein
MCVAGHGVPALPVIPAPDPWMNPGEPTFRKEVKMLLGGARSVTA